MTDSIRVQVKCLQHLNVIKYNPDSKDNKNNHLSYFDLHDTELDQDGHTAKKEKIESK